MKNKDYYSYYEIIFSLRKEYLKNQKIINKLLSYIRITSDSLNEYDSNLVFKNNTRDNSDHLLLIIKKRQSCIKNILESLYSSLVYGDEELKPGFFSFTFRQSEGYVYLLDDNQDGSYLNAKVEITNQKDFIETYNELIKNEICKSRTYLILKDEIIRLSNNGIHLYHVENDDYKNSVKLDYNGLEDIININNTSYLKYLMELKISKSIIPTYFENIIDNNMDNYLYRIEGDCNNNEVFYTIEEQEKKLVLKPQ